MACKGSWVRVPSAPPIQLEISIECGDRSASRWRASSPARGASSSRAGPALSRDGSPRLRFGFSVDDGGADRPLLEALQTFLGVGSIQDQPPAVAHQLPIVHVCASTRIEHTGRDDPVRGSVPPSLRQARPVRELARRARRVRARPSDPVRAEVPRRARCPDATSRSVAARSVAATTTVPPATEAVAAFIGGFVAAEGTLRLHRDRRPRFRFAVGLGRDGQRDVSRTSHAFFGCGSVCRLRRGASRTTTTSAPSSSRALRDHLAVTIPFMDEHLPVSYKREQYLAWRDTVARLLGARRQAGAAVHDRRVRRSPGGRTGCAGTTSTRRAGCDPVAPDSRPGGPRVLARRSDVAERRSIRRRDATRAIS